jgi:hypothetical protein
MSLVVKTLGTTAQEQLILYPESRIPTYMKRVQNYNHIHLTVY